MKSGKQSPLDCETLSIYEHTKSYTTYTENRIIMLHQGIKGASLSWEQLFGNHIKSHDTPVQLDNDRTQIIQNEKIKHYANYRQCDTMRPEKLCKERW